MSTEGMLKEVKRLLILADYMCLSRLRVKLRELFGFPVCLSGVTRSGTKEASSSGM